MASPSRSTVTLKLAIPGKPAIEVPGIPWFPGMTVFEAMVIGQAIDQRFEFQVRFHHEYGAFVNMIDGTADQGSWFWMVRVRGQDSALGISEAILQEAPGETVEVAWDYRDLQGSAQDDASRRPLRANAWKPG
ncbi:MAG TPA: hypothetical protein VGD78_11190 [Chthoniobacterales bacterium]